MYVLEVSKMILADDEGNLHWKYAYVHVYSHTYYTHIQHTHTHTHTHAHKRTSCFLTNTLKSKHG